MLFHNQKLTYYKNKEVQELLNIVLENISIVFKDIFTKDETTALILIGGYGRGEGGITQNGERFHPHNNLDLLYIHNSRVDASKVRYANLRLQEISKEYEIGIDMSAINKQKLLGLNGLVIGYDMRFGHKTLLGDSRFLQNNKEFSIYSIDPVDIRQLLVNRGTLLLINRILLDKENLNEEEKKLIIKHSIKAIIGYGDALLYFNNAYHWSYAQKQSNMLELKGVDNSIKELYSEAMLFRFMPDYETYLQKDLKVWNNKLIETLCCIHLTCEKINLSKDDLEWENYLNIALKKKSYPRQNILQKLKSSLHGVRNISLVKELNSFGESVSFMQFGARGMLSLLNSQNKR